MDIEKIKIFSTSILFPFSTKDGFNKYFVDVLKNNIPISKAAPAARNIGITSCFIR